MQCTVHVSVHCTCNEYTVVDNNGNRVGVLPWQRPSIHEVIDLVRVEMATEPGQKFNPLVATTLAVDKHQKRLLVQLNHIVLREGEDSR